MFSIHYIKGKIWHSVNISNIRFFLMHTNLKVKDSIFIINKNLTTIIL